MRHRRVILLPGEELPEDRRLRHARWALCMVTAIGLALGAVQLWEAGAVLVVAAGVLAWAR